MTSPPPRRSLVLAALLAALASAAGAEPAGARESLTVGRSVQGRPITAVVDGSRRARTRVLVVGSIHGNETAGHAVVRRLRRLTPPRDVAIWTLRTANPDGAARGIRHNARGVDLNRNFPHRWQPQGRPFDTYHSGPAPLSEPESLALRRLVRRVRPQVTIWYHQALGLVDLGSGANPALVRAYARRAGLPARRIAFLPGVATRWQNTSFPGASAFVVELERGRLSRAEIRRHSRAVHASARLARARAKHAARDARPRVHWRAIPFGAERRRQMRRYALRHYGIDSNRLRDLRVVVLHLSVTTSAGSVIDTFSRNVADPELGELPGLCTHFVIDPRGRIYQLVSLRLMCRHTVGLNHTSIGIEHVGMSEGDVIRRRRQLRASLRLVGWLQARFGIRTRDVIGHNESLRSPYHRERVRRLRRQTHADFPAPVARRYRRLLGR